MINQTIFQLLIRLWSYINPLRRGHFAMLLALMFLASFAEVISIGLVLPFLGVFTAPNHIFSLPEAKPFIQALNITEPTQLLLPLTIAFGVTVIFAGTLRLLLLWASTKLSFATGSDLSISI